MTRRIIRTSGLLTFDSPARLRKGDILIEEGKISAIGGITRQSGAMLSETPYLVIPAFSQGQVRLQESLFDRYFVPTPPRNQYRNIQIPRALGRLTETELELSINTGLDQVFNCGTSCVSFRISNSSEASLIIDLVAQRHCRAVFLLDLDKCPTPHAPEIEALINQIHQTKEPDLFHLALICRVPRPHLTRSLKSALTTAKQRNLRLFVESSSLRKADILKFLRPLEAQNTNLCIIPDSLDGISDSEVLAELQSHSATLHISPTHHLLMGGNVPDLGAAVESKVKIALSAYSGATRTAYNIFEELSLMTSWLEPYCSEPCIQSLGMATTNSAGSIGYPAGQIGVGQYGDLAALHIDIEGNPQPEAVARKIITEGSSCVQSLWIHGQPVSLPKKGQVPKTPAQARFMSQTRSKLKHSKETPTETTKLFLSSGLNRLRRSVRRLLWF